MTQRTDLVVSQRPNKRRVSDVVREVESRPDGGRPHLAQTVATTGRSVTSTHQKAMCASLVHILICVQQSSIVNLRMRIAQRSVHQKLCTGRQLVARLCLRHSSAGCVPQYLSGELPQQHNLSNCGLSCCAVPSQQRGESGPSQLHLPSYLTYHSMS